MRSLIDIEPEMTSFDTERVRALCYAGLVRGRFKYLRVSVREGRVRVSVPQRAGKALVADFIEKNLASVAFWLCEQARRKDERLRNDPFVACYADKGRIAYRGDVLRIRCAEAGVSARLENGELQVGVSATAGAEEISRAVRNWLQSRFEEALAARMTYWVQKTGLRPVGVKASSAKSRWGSCTRAGVVRVSWRTICLPPVVFDYVIVHELAHLRHFDHSPAFWRTVREHFEACDEARAFLRRVRAEELA